MLTSLFSLFYVTGEFHRFLHRGRAANTLAKIQVTANFSYARYAEKRFTQIYAERFVWRRQAGAIRMGTNMAAKNQRKHLSLSFATKA